MFIDTHTHIDLITTNKNEQDEIISTSLKKKVNSLFNISVNYQSNLTSKILSDEYKNVYFTVGIHPSEADSFSLDTIELLRPLVNHPKCIGIGEIGIDLYKNYAKIENQERLFEAFLYLAKEYKKPVIIHSRNAFNEIYEFINRSEFQDLKGIFHCFSYTYEEAFKIIDKGYFISFAGNLTYKNANNLQESAKKVSLDYVLLETDSPFLSPEPLRGKKNYPYNIVYIYEYLSKIKKIDIFKLCNIIKNNIKKVFPEVNL